MRRLVRPLAALSLATAVVAGPVPQLGASADPSCDGSTTGGISAGCEDPPGGGGPGEESGGPGGGGGGGGPRVCSVPGVEGEDDFVVDCETSAGVWSNDRLCYLQVVDPPPPKSDDVWDGNDEGVIVQCSPSEAYCNSLDPNPGAACVRPNTRWEAQPPAVLDPPDPAELARQAFASLALDPIDIGIVPEDEPGRIGLVGLPVWMWVENPDERTFGPDEASASDQGLTVTVRAEVDRIVWDLGDGTTVTCTGPGSPFEDRFAGEPSPDCGHRYTRQGEFEVTATSYWTATWSGGGQSGELSADRTTSTTVRVGELQVVAQ
ncbi:hypothetical protein GCM10009718_30590 [Isoptericola halotolerans]|uniref:PKD domain-containing protein n=1 Tax=Isoptericola halotolerans TaxID=300560 RepID=A0ABX2A416_9MICO|nr:hypothetical protein [Isoptericola halotolerans]NOV97602.1 hypothetical protein [Isoptericola halotolerans]